MNGVFAPMLRRGARMLGRLCGDRRGAVAPITAMVAIPMLILAGGGVDLSRAMAARTALQDAIDTAGLALARIPAGTPTATLQQMAVQWVTANVGDRDVGPVSVTTNEQTGQVQVTATSYVTTTMAALVGIQNIPVQATTTVKFGMNHVELALVLDNTGSMADDNKLSSLQSAASTLVSTLSQSAQASGDPNALKIGVVPFSISVNVGPTFQNASSTWLTGVQPAAYGPDLFNIGGVNRFTLLAAMHQTWGGCVESRPMPYDVQDTTPSIANPATLFVPFFAPDEPDDYVNYGGTKLGYGNTYLTDRAGDTTFANKQGDPLKYVGTPRTGQDYLSPYPIGPNSGCGTAAMLPLTTDMNAVNTELGKMVANGNTHIPLGLAWGWNLLSPNMPFGAQAYGTKNLLKIAVLVTDGANTYAIGSNNKICQSGNNLYYCPYTPTDNNSNYTGYGYVWQKRISNNQGSYSDYVSAMNDRLATLCTNMKASGLIIYTVPLEVTDPSIKSLLQNCATEPDYYIDVSSSTQLQAAFTNIAGSISALRISH